MKTICVFCGSHDAAYFEFTAKAAELGKYLAGRGINLVYGGSNCGLMGVVADNVIKNGGEAIAVMPKDLLKRCGHKDGTRLITVQSMQERKQKMIDLSDAFIVLPGGLGTLDEAFEVLTYRQLGYHKKPCGFLNVNNYFDHIFSFVREAVSHGFIKPEHEKLIFSTKIIEELVANLENQMIVK
ncbi:MAG: TIGR00730 family Rossman fold protein [Patescibacteria group bacterium]